jgi:hypothetical protein
MVLYWRTTTAIQMAYKVDVFSLSLIFLQPWWPLEQYGECSCPMAMSSSFQCSLGHAASGNVLCIARCTTMAIKMSSGGGTFICH